MGTLKQEKNFSIFVGKQLAKVIPLFSNHSQGKFDPDYKDDGAVFLHRRFNVECNAMEWIPEKLQNWVKSNVGTARFEGKIDLMVITWDRDNPGVKNHDSGLFPKYDGHLVLSILGGRCVFKIPVGFQIEEETYWTWCNCRYNDKKLQLLINEIKADLKDTVEWSLNMLKKIG